MVFDSVLTTQMQGPKLRTSALPEKLGVSACACKPSVLLGIDKQIPGAYWDMYELQVQGDTLSLKIRWEVIVK